MNSDSELERRLQAMAGTEVTPMPNRTALSTILARRAQGERLTLPTTAVGGFPLYWWVTGLAAAAALTIWLVRTDRGTLPVTDGQEQLAPAGGAPPGAEFNFLLPLPLMGQVSTSASFPRLDDAVGTRLTPGRWFYTRRGHEPIGRPTDTLIAFGIERSSYSGTDAWTFLAGIRDPRGRVVWSDTTWLNRESLRPFAQVRRPAPGYRIEQTWRADDILIGETRNGFTSWSSAPLVNSNPMLGQGQLIQWYQLFARLLTEQLGPDWKGSLSLAGGITPDSTDAFFNLAVFRDEVMEVPAGKIDCWKVGIGGEGNGLFFWVSKAQGWIVAMGSEYRDKRSIEQVLVSGESLP